MTKKDILKDLPLIIHPNQLCEICLMGKKSHNRFSKESTLRAINSIILILLSIRVLSLINKTLAKVWNLDEEGFAIH